MVSLVVWHANIYRFFLTKKLIVYIFAKMMIQTQSGNSNN